MTVATQLQQVISGVKGASETIKTFAMETQDQQAKQAFQDIAKTLDTATKTLKDRQKYIEEQEPQYKE